MKEPKKQPIIIIVKEEGWNDCIYKTREWEQSVIIDKWTHDFVSKDYTIVYFEK